MFLDLFLIFTFGCVGGYIFEKIKIPKLIWYLILGILLGPSIFDFISKDLLNISNYLRQIALIIILTRGGLSLDLEKLKSIGKSAFFLCFIPACFEMVGIVIFAPLWLKISYLEALLLGSVLAAVSPAVIVPRMLKLKEEGYGKTIPELIMAGASCDDVFVILLFYSFKNLLVSNQINFSLLFQIPTSILLGIFLGVLVGILFVFLFKKIKMPILVKVMLLFGTSCGLLVLEEKIKPVMLICSLLSILTLSIFLNRHVKEDILQMKSTYDHLWQCFEILLFVLVGVAVPISKAFSSDGLILLGIIIISLFFRSAGVLFCIMGTKYLWKEKVFIIFSYLPKATVQASIGAIALNDGLDCGNIVLAAAVIAILFTAPIGAFLIDLTSYRFLSKNEISLF